MRREIDRAPCASKTVSLNSKVGDKFLSKQDSRSFLKLDKHFATRPVILLTKQGSPRRVVNILPCVMTFQQKQKVYFVKYHLWAHPRCKDYIARLTRCGIEVHINSASGDGTNSWVVIRRRVCRYVTEISAGCEKSMYQKQQLRTTKVRTPGNWWLLQPDQKQRCHLGYLRIRTVFQ